ncbi:PREDICTED: vacuolar protein sorting-associated protein 13D isoform X2 [Nicrophorus vespilloides]|uniref:Vacuolar protein sorting-associated protein 13D isoform X2 n=1 Tax=Nicrophorus vespilloides TaxID=110193 RepID=A0ABM1MH80_NICVS|nr:PREDICTED: vacuolar protein sorting-associated protein 13D isoform X2 [Nicrophorus vespilloides]
MLEGLVAWVLNNYLGKYVENLNTEQLSIAVLSGEVELENLPLKRDALRHLGLPVQIKSGFIGKIKLQIPVRQIRSAPWIILIEQLYVVATPLPVREWDADVEAAAALDLKLSALDNLEARWRLENDSSNSTYYASSYSSWLNFGTGFITNIIENLQLKIRDVHIRYEDDISIPDKGVAFGITMESLSAQSCDEDWQPGFSYWDSSPASFKILEMQKLAVYWTDLPYSDLLSTMDRTQLTTAMGPQRKVEDNCYILAPVSAQAKIKRNRSLNPLRSADSPRVVCDLQLEEVPMVLADWQYDQIVKCTKGLDDIARYRAYRNYRPTCSVHDNPYSWWIYAISCMYPGQQPNICKPKPSWEMCHHRAKSNVAYVKIYTKILLTPTITLSTDEKNLKDEVEWSGSFEELKVLREIAMKSVPTPDRSTNGNNSAGRSMLVRWFPQWMGWYSQPPAQEDQQQPPVETAQLEGEILQALSDSVENNSLLKRDVVFGRFSFTLKSGTLSLCTTYEKTRESIPMLELQFKNLCLNIVSRPRSSSHLVELSLGAVYLCDKFTPNTLFPVLVGPPGTERGGPAGRGRGPSPRVSLVNRQADEMDCIFHMSYEQKPENSGCDYRLCVKSKSLDVVYQPSAVRWLTEFLCLPHQRTITQSQIEAMKSRTKKEFMKNWEQILDGRASARKSWDLQLDVTAPQIFFVEQFSNPNAAIAVIDFGRLQLRNNVEGIDLLKSDDSRKEDDDEMFMTPCSTPPASEESDSEQLTYMENNLPADTLNETSLHQKIYDRYSVELTDMQILIARVKDNWRYAHNKGTSTLHVLDRFNISLQIERRVIHTYDPLYPSLTLNANLPKLVAHFNEQKISAARKLAQIITATGLPSPFNSSECSVEETVMNGIDEESMSNNTTSAEMSRLLMLQFTVDHLAMEVQSRGRSVAELQVSGVKLGFTKRPVDVNITLSVHSLLLVDALQTFGPDFELLVASHKHVGMDSMSGSLRDSEPTSPTSPGSPDPNVTRIGATSPVALNQALSSLATSPPNLPFNRGGNRTAILDAEALISLDLLLVFGSDPMQIANIQFNNLDIIANQETIVELMGFVQRVFPELKSQKPSAMVSTPIVASSVHSSRESLAEEDNTRLGTTEITFDFHRLNVLLLRGVVKDGYVYGKKICTATMSEAKIQAVVNNGVTIEGSLGGLQVLDLTPEGHMHQRIMSVGRDPLLENTHPLYLMSATSTQNVDESKAFSFKIVRSLQPDADRAEVIVRMASLWYTHSPHFVVELQSCATEFKQYMANLARSIRTAATDMALGLVHARAEALAQSIYMNSRLSASIYGSALSFSDLTSPRRRRRSSSQDQSFSGYSSVRDTVPQTPYSPNEDDNFKIDLKLDIVLDSPVLVLPRANNSFQVFVAHLGNINVTNKHPYDGFEAREVRTEHYDIEVSDMNLFSLDTVTRRVPGPLMTSPEILYACDSLAIPILHDTIVRLKICRELPKKVGSPQHSIPNLLIDDDEDDDDNDDEEDNEYNTFETIEIHGTVVTDLKVSLTRGQYEQLLDTVQWLTSSPKLDDIHGTIKSTRANLADITEEDTGVTTLNMDPHVRAKLFPAVNMPKNSPAKNNLVSLKVNFELPVFTMELRGDTPMGEQGLVDLSFIDFGFTYDKGNAYETNIHVSLRSIYMEDLLQRAGSTQRDMVISSAGDDVALGLACVSRSCPNIYGFAHAGSPVHGSLPDHLGVNGFMERSHTVHIDAITDNSKACPSTPPPSPSVKSRPVKNLVLISTLLVNPAAPNFKTHYNSVQRSTSVDFNCLDLVISAESWVMVIDFFSAAPSDVTDSASSKSAGKEDNSEKETILENTETNISVRSLTMVLVRGDKQVAKANISNVDISINADGKRKEVDCTLGSISLMDLTMHGHLYRERFLTTGREALKFRYVRHGSSEIKDYDSQLTLNMSSVQYVHTKRFVVEIQSFFNHFSRFHAVMAGLRAATSGKKIKDEIARLSLILEAQSPVILLPVSTKSSKLIIVDLGELKVTNSFKYSGDAGTISALAKNSTDRKCLLDVMLLALDNVSLQTGEREVDSQEAHRGGDYCKLGNCVIRRCGPPLLTEKCHLKIHVERNLHSSICHNVPDMSIHGELSTLDCTLDISQYKLIRGFLAHNLGEDTEHILASVQPPPITADPNIHDVWILSSLRLDLLNVTVRLQQCETSEPLACINFIKSRLTVEGFSNISQDVDLVSQEILITDTRGGPNAFTEILKPIRSANHADLVQVEVHSRKRVDKSKFTILLNNMRLMCVFDWWKLVGEFILQDIEDPPASPSRQRSMQSDKKQDGIPFELKLNVTDSEVVVVEDTSDFDTNAVIFKSTTVVTYRSSMIEKPLSCNLNHCEMYSCVLGKEEETALSIIDPVTVNIEINKDRILEIYLNSLTVRLSYYDMRMFAQILNSLPQQMFSRKKNNDQFSEITRKRIEKLTALGFNAEDCVAALNSCGQKLDDAALWLTQNAVPNYIIASEDSTCKVVAIEVKSDNIFLCVIDDCDDADVPLLELTLSQLHLKQGLVKLDANSMESPTKGKLECVFGSDYYNRVLSGWEPIIEPWRCIVIWDHTHTHDVSRNRLQLTVESGDSLNVNITTTLTELYKQVRDSWTLDLSKAQKSSMAGYRQRSPFVPYALKNETGSPLYYSTLITEMDDIYDNDDVKKSGNKWYTVAPGETVPFSFKSRVKIRHSDSHKMRMHQLGVQIEGFQHITPVTVDKVGVYFRHATASIQNRSQKEIPQARIVFDVALEGSARKLVTVRSALLLINKLPESVEVKLESQLPHDAGTIWAPSKVFQVEKGCILPVPLVHAHSIIGVRPLDVEQRYTYCNPSISWESTSLAGDLMHEIKTCHSHRGMIYRFCAEIHRQNYPPDKSIVIAGYSNQRPQPAHTITLLPNVLLVNLLPVDLSYVVGNERGRVGAGAEVALTNINTDKTFELKVLLENFPTSTALQVPAGTTNFTYKLRLEDTRGRKLYLNAVVAPYYDSKVKIIISTPFWIVNKTGLPLVFRQGGVTAEAAGQFDEHEEARMVQPFLFSFADPDGSPSVVARVGTYVIPNGGAQWCQNFHLQRGVQVKKLKVTVRDGKPDVVFVVGIEVRQGRGKYRQTCIVTISPRFQLFNKSSYKLLFTQRCFAGDVLDPNSHYLTAFSNCYLPFHWPRLDQEQLLCVLIQDIPDCCWSGGLKIDSNYSQHINVRDANGRMFFLRLEVVLQCATFFIVFTDADTMPPPIRIDNFSEVPVKFVQTCCKDYVHSVARAHSSVPYAWDESTKDMLLTVEAPGGVSGVYNIKNLGPASSLTYENFIYIAFTGTFKKDRGVADPLDVETQELVLDVHNNRVVLGRKEHGRRSQLWRMTSTGQLHHEGSSPPLHPGQQRTENILVLDIEGTAPQPSQYTRLVLRRPDPRRKSTQTWRFTEEGRLRCVHHNMCVQAQDGFFGLRQGNAAVLGLPQPICHRTTDTGIPLEQAVSRQRLRPGSGYLSIEITTDGPTRVLNVYDMREKKKERMFASPDERDWSSIAVKQRPNLHYAEEKEDDVKLEREVQFTLRLNALGISLISRNPAQELLYAQFSNIVGEVLTTSKTKRLCISVENIQIDNQLFEAPIPIFLYVTPPSGRGGDDAQSKLPALDIRVEMQPVVNENAIIFNYLIVRLKKLTVHLEERLLLKLCEFVSYNSREEELCNADENDHEIQKILTQVSASHATRYYFGIIQLCPDQIRLSMKTATKLPKTLVNIKRKLGLTLIKFEDAGVDLETYKREHLFETMQFLMHSVVKHFKDELIWQAGIILGSVDFLGNPIGFMNDVSEGFSGLIHDGNVGALVKNVAHGISNSAAKVTESLSDGLGRVAMDDEHEEIRQKIRHVIPGSSKDHLVAGIKGLGFGFLGGATGIFKQVYQGAANEGLPGMFSGFGKGIVGAVAKPVVGVLDLASETARAVRDSSRTSSKMMPKRSRPPRCVFGPGGLLPRYSLKQSVGQQYLFNINDRNFDEQLVAYENLRGGSENLRVLISDQRVRIVTKPTPQNVTTVIEVNLSDLEKCRAIQKTEGGDSRHYIELTVHVTGSSMTLVYQDPVKKPKVRCDSLEVAKIVTRQVNYAKRLYDERKHTLNTDNITYED